MSQAISLKRNFALTLLGNFVYGGAQWAMLVVIAKLGSPVIVGRFALALAVTAPVIMFASLGLRSVLATDAAKKYEFGEYLGVTLIMMAAAFLVIAVLGLRLGGAQDVDLALIVVVVGFAKALEQVSEVFYGLMQQHERMDLIARSLVFKGIVSLVLFSTAMFVTRSLLWGAVFLAVSWAMALFVNDRNNARRSLGAQAAKTSFLPRFRLPRLKSLAALSLPLGFAALLYALLVNIPRYFVGKMLGERELGIFAAMAYVSIVGVRVVTALGATAVPRLAKHYQQGDCARYTRLVLQTVAVGVFIGGGSTLIAAVAGRQILTLLYRPEYAERLDAFVWLMFSAGVGYVVIFLEDALTAAGRFWAQPLVISTTAAVLAVASVFLIPAHGIAGVAMAMTASNCVQLLCNAWLVRGIVKELRSRERA